MIASLRATRRDPVPTVAALELDVTVLVKCFERPDSFHRLMASIRRFYPQIPVLVVDDSASPLENVPEGVRYFHLPYNSVGPAAGRNFGLRKIETEYVLVCDDDMVFGRKTRLHRMLRVLETSRFDLVSCRWMDHDPWRSIRLGRARFEGSAEVVDGNLIRRLGAVRDYVDDFPAYDVLPNFFMAPVERLGLDPWDERLGLQEHVDFFMTMKDRGLLATRLPDVVVYHYPQLPPHYAELRLNVKADHEAWRQKRGFDQRIHEGRWFTRRDRVRYYLPSVAWYAVRNGPRILGRRLLRTASR